MKKHLPLSILIAVTVSLLGMGGFIYIMTYHGYSHENGNQAALRDELILGLENGSIDRSGEELVPLLKSIKAQDESSLEVIRGCYGASQSLGSMMIALGVLQFVSLFKLRKNLVSKS